MATTNRTASSETTGTKRKKAKMPATEKGLKIDVGSLTSSSLAGMAAFFDALNKSDKRKPVVTGNVQIGKKKSVKKK